MCGGARKREGVVLGETQIVHGLIEAIVGIDFQAERFTNRTHSNQS